MNQCLDARRLVTMPSKKDPWDFKSMIMKPEKINSAITLNCSINIEEVIEKMFPKNRRDSLVEEGVILTEIENLSNIYL